MRSLGIAVVALSGCLGETTPTALPMAGGVESFATDAQPILGPRCANPSCHGNLERPLSLYEVHRHRREPADRYGDRPLTSVELEHNLTRAASFIIDGDRPRDVLLLTKPLGGHAGTAVFAATTDHDYLRLLAWVERARDEAEAP